MKPLTTTSLILGTSSVDLQNNCNTLLKRTVLLGQPGVESLCLMTITHLNEEGSVRGSPVQYVNANFTTLLKGNILYTIGIIIKFSMTIFHPLYEP